MKRFKADMHIHSCLSPCADLQMSPRRIVDQACKVGLDVIALCDHNSADNVTAAMNIGQERGLSVLPGMEVCSREEVHIVALFQQPEQALEMQAHVYAHLAGDNNVKLFGDQLVVNEADEILSENPRMLIGATDLEIRAIVEQVHHIGGLSIASHVDRQAFGIIGQLGFIPDGLALDGIEISSRTTPRDARASIDGIQDYPYVTSSDAHYLADIGKAHTLLEVLKPTLSEIGLALKGLDGRRIVEQ